MRTPNMVLIHRDDRHNNWCEYHLASWISNARHQVSLMNAVAGWHALRQDQGGQELGDNCFQELILFSSWSGYLNQSVGHRTE